MRTRRRRPGGASGSRSRRAGRSVLPLESPRLVLRRFAADDIPAFVAYRNDPEVARYQGWEACNVEEATALVGKAGEPLTPGEWFQIAFALRDSDALVGDCGLKVHESEPRHATIGITVASAYQGRGLAS
jgi:RimJ/RimL family protein N-acetyltransferase